MSFIIIILRVVSRLVCKKLEKKNDEICQVKYKIKTKKGQTNYKKMRVKHLKQILADRGVTCNGCTEKSEFVKKCEKTEIIMTTGQRLLDGDKKEINEETPMLVRCFWGFSVLILFLKLSNFQTEIVIFDQK